VDHLSQEQRAELREALERMLVRLERSMLATDRAAAPVELDQTTVGRLSRMDSLQNQGLTRNLQERERVNLMEIEKALRRIEDGTYGLCTSCRDEIPFGRLLVMPETATCAACG
jgi:DnaK suppressor protein